MNPTRPLVVCVGEILWDVLPTGKVLGGAPVNVCWHAAQLGADARILSAVGQDDLGRELLDSLGQMGMNGDYVYVIHDKPTSLVNAAISDDGVASYVLRPDVAWDYIPVSESALAQVRQADALNFGSLAQRGNGGKRMMEAYLRAASPECLKVFDVNLRPGCIRREVLEACFPLCDMVKLNAEELLVIAELFNWPGRAELVLDQILQSYSNIGHIVVTRGADGVWWKTADILLKRSGRAIRIADTIGAGDALTAACIVGLQRGYAPERIVDVALDISSFVCTQIGATPALPDDLGSAFCERAMQE